jgi:hypothetical protein
MKNVSTIIKCLVSLTFLFFLAACKKNNSSTPVIGGPFNVTKILVNNNSSGSLTFYNVDLKPSIQVSFSAPLSTISVPSNVSFSNQGATVAATYAYSNNDSTLIIQPATPLTPLNNYTLSILSNLKSKGDSSLKMVTRINLITRIDSTDKFPRISDSALLDLVEKQTFKYFWDFGHPVSGMARERSNGDNETVTTGGTGFGIMGMIAAAHRGFISRQDAANRISTITNFLLTKCDRWHGAFAHWINGSTGATIPFGKNTGADIVETSFLVQGLLTARQYFNDNNAKEIALRDSINSIWNGVDWKWFTQNGGTQSLYWQYNPSYSNSSDIWSIPVSGWNEALITYILAASSPGHAISKSIYDNGWARNGGMKNGKSYYNIVLPLGPDLGGPLFFAHYSFLGLNPNQLSDQYANYLDQNTAHSKINYQYCVLNPQQFNGYSNLCWGLTASDDNKGYDAHSPTNDDGVISPTAAVSSIPYTPTESMNALRFFYYKLGDKVFGAYGFIDGFNLSQLWFSNSFLAIDQGPQIVMIENYRSGLLWNLFMSCPEVKQGLKALDFSSPYL